MRHGNGSRSVVGYRQSDIDERPVDEIKGIGRLEHIALGSWVIRLKKGAKRRKNAGRQRGEELT